MKKLSVFLLALGSTIFLVGCNKTPSTTISTDSLDTFAQCLTDAGAKMYGTATCSHCLAQKELFGTSFAKITYVDCTANPTACSSLKSVPTWEFKDGSQLVGVQTFATLSEKSNCTLPQ